jgi:probable HAF family extracellular repeat protein
VVWQNGLPTDLGGLGVLNFAAGINNRGQVLGGSVLPDGTVRSFLWQNGVITDLGTLPGHPLTIPGSINNKGQVVGHSCDATDTFCSAYLWQNGMITDLNTLIPPSSVSLYYAGDINDRGEIVGETAVDPITGASPAFLAIPCDDEHTDDQGCQAASQAPVSVERPRMVLPENVREQLGQRILFGRFGTRLMKQQ